MFEQPQERLLSEDCVICGTKMYTIHETHNPWPVKKEGRCCTQCNMTKVIPARIRRQHGESNEC